MDGHDKWSAKLGEAGEADVWHRNVTRAPLLPSWGGSARASKWKRQERKGKESMRLYFHLFFLSVCLAQLPPNKVCCTLISPCGDSMSIRSIDPGAQVL